MNSFIKLVIASYLSLVLAAPPIIDSATLLRNGQEAQSLNADFACMDASDACVSGNFACIDGALAKCVNGAWQLTQCPPSSEACFALPSFSNNGTVLMCTTESSALSALSASGVQGGLPTSCDDEDGEGEGDDPCSDNPETSASPSASVSVSSSIPVSSSSVLVSASSSSGDVTTVTQTITTLPTSVVTLPPQTLTLQPSEASGVLASLLAGGASIVTVLPPSPSGKGDSRAASASSAVATTILLTPRPTASAVLYTDIASGY